MNSGTAQRHGQSREGVDEFCREIEAYLCRKNDGHLIRITGPSFDLVAGWAVGGVPLKIAFRGIDRYFERYYRKGPRRRPVRVDFCEADVLDVFDEWRRAIGIATPAAHDETSDAGNRDAARKGLSLPAHLERVVLRLTSARAGGRLGPEFDELIDRVARELDAARTASHGLRGGARQALVERLSALDAELMRAARASLEEATETALAREADEELAAFRDRMAPEAFARIRDSAIARLVRERLGLPTLSYA